MIPQRAVHRFMSAFAKLPHIGWVYRSEAVTRTGRVIETKYVAIDSVVWC